MLKTKSKLDYFTDGVLTVTAVSIFFMFCCYFLILGLFHYDVGGNEPIFNETMTCYLNSVFQENSENPVLSFQSFLILLLKFLKNFLFPFMIADCFHLGFILIYKCSCCKCSYFGGIFIFYGM